MEALLRVSILTSWQFDTLHHRKEVRKVIQKLQSCNCKNRRSNSLFFPLLSPLFPLVSLYSETSRDHKTTDSRLFQEKRSSSFATFPKFRADMYWLFRCLNRLNFRYKNNRKPSSSKQEYSSASVLLNLIWVCFTKLAATT